MPLKRERDLPIPEYARDFISRLNNDRVQRGDLPLSEEQIQRIVEGLQDLRQRF